MKITNVYAVVKEQILKGFSSTPEIQLDEDCGLRANNPECILAYSSARELWGGSVEGWQYGGCTIKRRF